MVKSESKGINALFKTGFNNTNLLPGGFLLAVAEELRTGCSSGMVTIV